VKRLIVGGVRRAMGPGYDVDTHFTPRYNPWDQRVCLVPDGDLFAALKSGRARW
jgi:monooxygenase